MQNNVSERNIKNTTYFTVKYIKKQSIHIYTYAMKNYKIDIQIQHIRYIGHSTLGTHLATD